MKKPKQTELREINTKIRDLLATLLNYYTPRDLAKRLGTSTILIREIFGPTKDIRIKTGTKFLKYHGMIKETADLIIERDVIQAEKYRDIEYKPRKDAAQYMDSKESIAQFKKEHKNNFLCMKW